MNFYDLDSTPSYRAETLEHGLVDRVRRCWNDRQHQTAEARANLKDAIRELRTFRTNRERHPELHAQLDKEAIENWRGSGLLTHSQAQWDIFCRNKHLLTRTQLDEPTQESLIEGLPAPIEQPKGRVRTRPPVERIDTVYFTETRTEIENGKLTPYLPVRQMCRFIAETGEQRAFLNSVRYLAKGREDDPDFSREYRRIHRVATRVINELDEIKINGTQLDFIGQLTA